MDKHKGSLDLGMLCRCCNCRSPQLPDMNGFSESEIKSIEALCKLCVESFQSYSDAALA